MLLRQTVFPYGKTLFQENCASCHGIGGQGDGGAATALSPAPANLAAHRYQASYVLNILWNGKPGSSMPAWRDLDRSKLNALSAYVVSLNSPQIPAPAALAADSSTVRLFQKNCASCHGEAGYGNRRCLDFIVVATSRFATVDGATEV